MRALTTTEGGVPLDPYSGGRIFDAAPSIPSVVSCHQAAEGSNVQM